MCDIQYNQTIELREHLHSVQGIFPEGCAQPYWWINNTYSTIITHLWFCNLQRSQLVCLSSIAAWCTLILSPTQLSCCNKWRGATGPLLFALLPPNHSVGVLSIWGRRRRVIKWWVSLSRRGPLLISKTLCDNTSWHSSSAQALHHSNRKSMKVYVLLGVSQEPWQWLTAFAIPAAPRQIIRRSKSAKGWEMGEPNVHSLLSELALDADLFAKQLPETRVLGCQGDGWWWWRWWWWCFYVHMYASFSFRAFSPLFQCRKHLRVIAINHKGRPLNNCWASIFYYAVLVLTPHLEFCNGNNVSFFLKH